MKKFLSIILMATILLTSVSQSFVFFAKEDNSDLYEFVDELSRVIRENDVEEAVASGESIIGDVTFSVNKFFTNMKPSSIYDNLPENAFETKRLIVKAETLSDYQGAVDCVNGYNNLHILQYDTQLSAKNAYEFYLDNPLVEYVEPDVIYSAEEDIPGEIIPDDGVTDFDDVTASAIEWLSDKIGFSDIKEELAKRIEDDYVLVAVLDSGVDTDHSLFEGRLEESTVNLSSSGHRDSVEDDYGHGTHVSGIVASYTLENVKIKPYKVLNEMGNGALSVIASAIDMAVADGVDVINISISGDGESQTMTNAIDNAVANDINVVVAAGNKKVDLTKKYISPACVESAITVSATDKNDTIAAFSNYNGPIDIAAPGVDIISSYPDDKYLSMSGTSMAAPQVTAALAILQSISLNVASSECEEKIEDLAIKVREENGENKYGAGILFIKYILDGKPVTADPVFSVPSGTFEKTFQVEITCPDVDANIYYYIYDGDFSTINFNDSIVYEGPITVSVDTKISAVAILRGCDMSSLVTVEYDRIGQSIEDYYDINSFGYITGYYGSDKEVVVPDVIKGKKVNGIGVAAFRDNRTAETIILPDTCNKINASAFEGCSKLKSISGSAIDNVASSAFEGSSVETVDFLELKSIGMYSFADCTNLKSITLSNVETINNYAFINTLNLGVVVCDKLVDIGKEAFSGSGISLFNAPELTSIGSNAFSDCSYLVSVSAPKLEVLEIGAFKNCISLKDIKLDALIEIKANAFRNSAVDKFIGLNVEKVGNYAFADNPHLVACALMKTKSTGAYVFQSCTSFKIAILPELEELNGNMFENCPLLLNISLPKVKSVIKNAFKGSSVEYLMFEQAETIKSLPDTLKGVLLPDNTTSITYVPKTDFIVYGHDDSYAYDFAMSNGKQFMPVPAFHEASSTQVTAGDEYIVVYAFGFNCEYQWYRNDKVSNEGGTPIEGATKFYYMPSPDDDCEAYYCVVTSKDDNHETSNASAPVVNAPEYRKANYTEYNKIIIEANSLNRDLYDEEILSQLDEMLNVDFSNLKLSQQGILDNYVMQLDELLTSIKASFVYGDLNGDKIVSAIDARFALKYIVDNHNFTEKEFVAADMDCNGEITTIDARLILKTSLEQ